MDLKLTSEYTGKVKNVVEYDTEKEFSRFNVFIVLEGRHIFFEYMTEDNVIELGDSELLLSVIDYITSALCAAVKDYSCYKKHCTNEEFLRKIEIAKQNFESAKMLFDSTNEVAVTKKLVKLQLYIEEKIGTLTSAE